MKRDGDSICECLVKSSETDRRVYEVIPSDRTQLLEFLRIPPGVGQSDASTFLRDSGVIGINPACRLGATDRAVGVAIGLGMRFEVDEVHDANEGTVDAF